MTLHTNTTTQQSIVLWWDSISDQKPMLEAAFANYANASRDERKRRVKELVTFYRTLSQTNHPAAADTLYVHLGQMVLHLRLSYEASLRETTRSPHQHYQFAQSELLKLQQHLTQYGIITVFA